MSDLATIQIDKKMIETLVERKMQAAIIAELDGTKDLLLERMVSYMLNQKVDSQGNVDKHGYGDSKTLVQYLCHKRILEVAKASLEKFIDGHAPEIEKILVKELTKQKSAFAKMAVGAMTETFKQQFRWNVKIDVGPEETRSR